MIIQITKSISLFAEHFKVAFMHLPNSVQKNKNLPTDLKYAKMCNNDTVLCLQGCPILLYPPGEGYLQMSLMTVELYRGICGWAS